MEDTHRRLTRPQEPLSTSSYWDPEPCFHCRPLALFEIFFLLHFCRFTKI